MSAIWGAISLSIHEMTDVAENMEHAMEKYAIDRIERVIGKSYYFACGHQHFTSEAERDISPVYDDGRKLVFTADSYLVNRSEIIEKIRNYDDSWNSKAGKLEECGDAFLLYLAYCKYGVEFVEHVRGSFACAVYLLEERKLLLFADHVATRYLAYCVNDEYITFGTTYGAINACCSEKKEINKEFVIREFVDLSPMTFNVPDITVFKGVYHVNMGSYVTIDCSNKGVQKHIYWDPVHSVKKIKNKSDEECKRLFLKTYEKVIRSYLRSSKNTAIALSGGLDSSSVAAFAAPALEEVGQKLYSYTMVPAEDYSYENRAMQNENETAFIIAQQKQHKNLFPQYINGNIGNCFSDIEAWQEMYESPVRPVINLTGISSMFCAAKKDNCKILLTGGYGNSSITYGNIFEYFSLKVQSGHPIQAYREVAEYCRAWKSSRLTFAKLHLKGMNKFILPYRLSVNKYLKDSDVRKYRIRTMMRKANKRFGNRLFSTKHCRENELINKLQLQHMGYYNTYKSLIYGVLPLDVTCDVNLIELCQSLPLECFVKGADERRLVRGYMSELIPKMILDPTQGRGIQAADYAFRVNRDWDKIGTEVYELLGNSILDRYLKRSEINKLIQEIKSNEKGLDKSTIREAVIICSLSSFLQQYENQ